MVLLTLGNVSVIFLHYVAVFARIFIHNKLIEEAAATGLETSF